MKIGNNVYNFDRVVRLTLFNPNDLDENGNLRNVIILEYDPLSETEVDGKKVKKETSVARIDFEVTNIGPKNRNQKPGFTADIILYNVTDNVSQAIAQNGDFGEYEDISNPSKREESYKNFLERRLQCKLEAGYSNGSGEATTQTLFQGYVNSSFSFRKGVDRVTHLMCFNSDDTSAQFPETSTLDSKINYNEKTEQERFEESFSATTWDSMFKNQVIFKTLSRPATAHYEGGFFKTRQVSNYSRVVTVLERIPSNFDEWFKLEYVTKPNSTTIDKSLESKMKNFNVKGFYTSKKDLDSSLFDLCSYNGLNLGWGMKLDPEGKDNRWIYQVWETGNGKIMDSGDKADIQIVNYYGLVDNPTINGNGNLTLKMMLYPDAEPYQTVSLLIKDTGETAKDFSYSYESINAASLTQTQQNVAGSLSSGNFTALVQGPYAIQVFAKDKKSKGYMFNKAYTIIKVVHKGSTHSKEWYTTLTTIPLAMGYSNKDVVRRRGLTERQ